MADGAVGEPLAKRSKELLSTKRDVEHVSSRDENNANNNGDDDTDDTDIDEPPPLVEDPTGGVDFGLPLLVDFPEGGGGILEGPVEVTTSSPRKDTPTTTTTTTTTTNTTTTSDVEDPLHPSPCRWCGTNRVIQQVPLSPYHPEYSEVVRKFQTDWRGVHSTGHEVVVIGIDCFQNWKAHHRFTRYRRDHPDVPMRLLWHGTALWNVPGILERGFDLSEAGDGVYGRGVYLASNPAYCHIFGWAATRRSEDNDPGEEHATIGAYVVGYERQELNIGYENSGWMAVCYNPEAVYPAYVLHVKAPKEEMGLS